MFPAILTVWWPKGACGGEWTVEGPGAVEDLCEIQI